METVLLGTALLHKHLIPKSKGTIVLVHAMYQNSDYFARPEGASFTDFLNRNGFNVFRLDLSGYGIKEANKGTSFCSYVEDVVSAIDLARADGCSEAIFVLGHSVSGLVAQVAGNLKKVNAIVSVAPAIWTFVSSDNSVLAAVQAGKFFIGYALSEVLGQFPASLLKMGNRAAPLGYMREYCSWIVRRKFQSLDGQIDYHQILKTGTVPTLLIAGSGDRVLAPAANVQWLAQTCSIQERDILRISKKNGFAYDGDHFSIVHGKRAANEVWPQLLEWLEARDMARV